MRHVTLVVVGDPNAPQMRLLKRLPEQVEVIVSNNFDELRAAVPKADVLLNGGFHNSLFTLVFPFANKAQWVHNMSTGVEGVLSPEVISSPIPLTNGRGVFNNILAEFVAAAILYFAKDLRRMIRNQQAGRWEQFDVLPARGATLGIIGYGNLGRETAKVAHCLGMKVVALRRSGNIDNDELLAGAYTRDRIYEMLAICDYLAIAAPLTEETRGMIGERELNALKPDAVVINIGRGPILNESALVRALESRRIKGAALDVFDQEPLPPGHPFFRLENVLLSPHCADHTAGWPDLAMNKFLEIFQNFWNNQPLFNVVDKKAGY